MTETRSPATTPATTDSLPPKRRRFKLTDIIITAVLAVIIIALAITLMRLLRVRQEIQGARSVTDRVANDVANINAGDALKLADIKFKKAHSEKQLNAVFTEASNFTKGDRTIDEKLVGGTDDGKRFVSIIYQYKSADTKPYYVRITTVNTDGHWQLTGLTGTEDKTSFEE